MTLSEQQQDIRRAYVGGGAGVIVSSTIWFIAAWAEQARGVAFAFVVLFVGGMFIFPVSTLLARFVFRRAGEAKGNSLGMTALESTIAMIGGLLAAWLILPFKPDYVFPLAAVAVGTHYAVFKTVYGDKLFWALGAVITAIGLLPIFAGPVPGGVILAVAVIEALFGVLLTVRAVRRIDLKTTSI